MRLNRVTFDVVMAVDVVPLNCESLGCRGEELHVQWEEFQLLIKHCGAGS